MVFSSQFDDQLQNIFESYQPSVKKIIEAINEFKEKYPPNSLTIYEYTNGRQIAQQYAGEETDSYRLANGLLTLNQLHFERLSDTEILFLYLFVVDLPERGQFTSYYQIANIINITPQSAKRLLRSVIKKIGIEIRSTINVQEQKKVEPKSPYNILKSLLAQANGIPESWILTPFQNSVVLIILECYKKNQQFPSLTEVAQLLETRQSTLSNEIKRILDRIENPFEEGTLLDDQNLALSERHYDIVSLFGTANTEEIERIIETCGLHDDEKLIVRLLLKKNENGRYFSYATIQTITGMTLRRVYHLSNTARNKLINKSFEG